MLFNALHFYMGVNNLKLDKIKKKENGKVV
jgi:hypothetical protein